MASSEEKHATERTALLNPPEAERGVVNADEEALNKLGYGQQLSRTLGFFSMFGFAFKFLSPVVGVYSMFGVGLSTAGPQFIWILPYVVVGQLMVRELALELVEALELRRFGFYDLIDLFSAGRFRFQRTCCALSDCGRHVRVDSTPGGSSLWMGGRLDLPVGPPDYHGVHESRRCSLLA